MMKRILILFSFVLLVAGVANAQAMSDEEVISYVKNGVNQGKSQQALYKELVARGVSTSQMQRIKDKYEQQKENAVANKGNNNVDTQRVNPEQAEDKAPAQSNDLNVDGPEGGIKVFGRDIFRTANLTFEPSMNIATPVNYRLGPGDQLQIEVWGASEANITQKVTPDRKSTRLNSSH